MGESYFCRVCIIASFLLMTSLTEVSPLRAQQSASCPQCVTIAATDKTLAAVMAEVSAQSRLNFHYDKTDRKSVV